MSVRDIAALLKAGVESLPLRYSITGYQEIPGVPDATPQGPCFTLPRMKKLPLWIDRLTAGKLVAGSALLLLNFSLAYFLATMCGQGILGTYPNAQTASIWDCLYFSVITFSSLGYGDFRPVGFSRLLASLEVFLGYQCSDLRLRRSRR